MVHAIISKRILGCVERIFLCGETRFSLASSARSSQTDCHRTQQSPVPTHVATAHQCPPSTSTPLLPSILSFVICSSYPRRLLTARSHSSRPATSTGIYHLYSDGGCVISIANVGSMLASCLQHLSGGSACYCCTVFGWSMRKRKGKGKTWGVWVVGWQRSLSPGVWLCTRACALSIGRVAAPPHIEG